MDIESAAKKHKAVLWKIVDSKGNSISPHKAKLSGIPMFIQHPDAVHTVGRRWCITRDHMDTNASDLAWLQLAKSKKQYEAVETTLYSSTDNAEIDMMMRKEETLRALARNSAEVCHYVDAAELSTACEQGEAFASFSVSLLTLSVPVCDRGCGALRGCSQSTYRA